MRSQHLNGQQGCIQFSSKRKSKRPWSKTKPENLAVPYTNAKPQCSVKTGLAMQSEHRNSLKSLQESSVQCSETPCKTNEKVGGKRKRRKGNWLPKEGPQCKISP